MNNYEGQPHVRWPTTMSNQSTWTLNWTNFQQSMQAVQRAMENITIIDTNLDQERRDAHEATVPAWAEDDMDPPPMNRERR